MFSVSDLTLPRMKHAFELETINVNVGSPLNHAAFDILVNNGKND